MSDRVGPLGITGAQYWDSPWLNTDALYDELRPKPGTTLILDAPARVDVEKRQTLPLLAYHAGRSLELYRVPFEGHGLVTAMDVDRNVLYASPVLPVEDRDPIEDPVPGFHAVARILDLRELLGLLWRPSRLVVRGFLLDQSVDPLEVELVPAARIFDDPAMNAYVTERRDAPRPPRVSRPDDVPVTGFRADANSPEPPSHSGLALSVGRIAEAQPGARHLLYGSLRASIRATERVEDGVDVGDPDARAVVRVSLLVFGAENKALSVVPINVPIYELEGESGVGIFAVDLLRLSGVADISQTYFVYGFVHEAFVGPVPMSVVTPDLLE